MGVELDVWAEHKINFVSLAKAIDFIETKLETTITRQSRSEKKVLEETQNISEIQYFADFDRLKTEFKRNKRIELTTNFFYSHRIIIYPQTLNFWGKGFYTRDSRWMDLIRKDFQDELYWDEKLATQYTNNWEQFRNYCCEITKNLGGEKIIYIRDNFQMIDKFFAGESLQSGIEYELAVGVSEHYELKLVEHFSDDFKHKYVWFFEDLRI